MSTKQSSENTNRREKTTTKEDLILLLENLDRRQVEQKEILKKYPEWTYDKLSLKDEYSEWTYDRILQDKVRNLPYIPQSDEDLEEMRNLSRLSEIVSLGAYARPPTVIPCPLGFVSDTVFYCPDMGERMLQQRPSLNKKGCGLPEGRLLSNTEAFIIASAIQEAVDTINDGGQPMPFFDICHQFDISGKYPEEVHENLASRTEGGQEAIDLCIRLRTDVALEKAEEYGMPPYPFNDTVHPTIEELMKFEKAIDEHKEHLRKLDSIKDEKDQPPTSVRTTLLTKEDCGTEGYSAWIQCGEVFDKITWNPPEKVTIKYTEKCNPEDQEGLTINTGWGWGWAAASFGDQGDGVYGRYAGWSEHVMRILEEK